MTNFFLIFFHKQIGALFEPILNSTPSISALLLLAQKERCIHGDSTAPSCTYLVHVYRRRFNHGDPHFTNLCLFSSSSSLIKTFVFLQLLADFKEYLRKDSGLNLLTYPLISTPIFRWNCLYFLKTSTFSSFNFSKPLLSVLIVKKIIKSSPLTSKGFLRGP